jgi:hypothetical protein
MDHGGNELADVGGFRPDDHFAGFELGEVQHVVDELKQRVSAGGNGGQRLGPLISVSMPSSRSSE